MKYSIKIFCVLYLVLQIVIFTNNFSYASGSFFVFSGKGEFIEIDAVKSQVRKKANLWRHGIYRVYGGAIDEKKSRIYLKSDYAIVVLDKGSQSLLKKIEVPSPEDLMNVYVSDDGSRLAISWLDDQGKATTRMYDSLTFKAVKDLPCETISKKQGFISANEFVCISTERNERFVKVIDVEKNRIQKTFSLNERLASVDRNIQIVEVDRMLNRMLLLKYKPFEKGAEKQSELFVYDLMTDTVSPGIKLKIDGEEILGDYHLIRERSLIAIEEYGVVPVNGSVVEKRKKGKIQIFNSETGKRTSLISVEKTGDIVGFSNDGTRLYYLTPGHLSIIGVDKGVVQSSIDFSAERSTADKNTPYNITLF